jgi:hypothetical protein
MTAAAIRATVDGAAESVYGWASAMKLNRAITQMPTIILFPHLYEIFIVGKSH